MFSSLFKLLCACLQLISIHTQMEGFKSESDIVRSILEKFLWSLKQKRDPKGQAQVHRRFVGILQFKTHGTLLSRCTVKSEVVNNM